MWRIKINCRWCLGRLSTNLMSLLLIKIHFETNIFLSTKVIWKREKRGFISFLLTNTVKPDKQEMFMKNGNEGRDVLVDSRKRYRCPWAEIGKFGPHREPIRSQDSLPCPLREKKVINSVIACRGDYQNDSTDAILLVYNRRLIEQLALEIICRTDLLSQFCFRSPNSAETNSCTL